jgi:hypothetical protein
VRGDVCVCVCVCAVCVVNGETVRECVSARRFFLFFLLVCCCVDCAVKIKNSYEDWRRWLKNKAQFQVSGGNLDFLEWTFWC